MAEKTAWGTRVAEARRALRDERGRPPSQERIARSLGKPQQWLNRIENGTTKQIPLDDLSGLCDALGADVYHVLTGHDYKVELSDHLRQLKKWDDEKAIDERGWITIRQVARQQVALTTAATKDDGIEAAFRAIQQAGIIPAAEVARAIQSARALLASSESATEETPPTPRPARRRQEG